MLKMVCYCLVIEGGVNRCVDLHLGLQFDSIEQPICFDANTMQLFLR